MLSSGIILNTNSFKKLIKDADLTEKTEAKIIELTKHLIDLEKNNWDGIWARILGNYLATANLGKFDIIVGNPPWVDWKSLPSGYRERIKGLCISRKLFSGDRLTGGINLNICDNCKHAKSPENDKNKVYCSVDLI